MADTNIKSADIVSAKIESVPSLVIPGDPTVANIDPTCPDERVAESVGNAKSKAANAGNAGSH